MGWYRLLPPAQGAPAPEREDCVAGGRPPPARSDGALRRQPENPETRPVPFQQEGNVRISLSSLPLAVVALVAACTSDAVLTAPSDPTTPGAAVQPEMRRVVIDSTRLAFAGTAAERAAGHYVFTIQDSVPALAPGDYVAGRQGGLVLGRVRAGVQ